MARRSSRWTIVIAVIVITIIVVGVVGVRLYLDRVSAEFVRRNGNVLTLDSRPYRFVGVNNYDLTGVHTGYPAPASDAEAFFAQLPPNTMIRVWAFEEWGLDAVIDTVRLAEKHNQKLILALADGSGQSGRAPDLTAEWYESGYKGAFHNAKWGQDINYWDWVTKVVGELKDSPAVAIWELMNEPGSTASGLTAPIMKSFYDTVAAHIKHIDRRHLVSTGALSPADPFQRGVSDYAWVHSGPDIDLVSVHEYDYPFSNGENIGSHWFDVALQAARTLGKPIYVGETGISLAVGCMTADERADALRKKFDFYLGAGASGVLYWATIGPPNNPGTVCDSKNGNNDPMVGGAVIELIRSYRVPP